MKEIEIKARLKDKKAVVTKLEELGCVFGKVMTQRDVVYVKNVGSFEIFNSNDAFLRIRVKDNSKILFTVKKPMKNDLDALEHEVEVSSKEEMEQAILLMGFKEAVRINKTRQTTTYNGCEICIDDVEGLGGFIEMEKLATEGDSEQVQEELFKFFESIGIKKEDRVFLGYDNLILSKK